MLARCMMFLLLAPLLSARLKTLRSASMAASLAAVLPVRTCTATKFSCLKSIWWHKKEFKLSDCVQFQVLVLCLPSTRMKNSFSCLKTIGTSFCRQEHHVKMALDLLEVREALVTRCSAGTKLFCEKKMRARKIPLTPFTVGLYSLRSTRQYSFISSFCVSRNCTVTSITKLCRMPVGSVVLVHFLTPVDTFLPCDASVVGIISIVSHH